MSTMEGSEGGGLARMMTGVAFLVWVSSLIKLSVPSYVLYEPDNIILIFCAFFLWSAVPTALGPDVTLTDTIFKVIMTLTPIVVFYSTYNTVLNYRKQNWLLWVFAFMLIFFAFQYARVFMRVNVFASNHLICSYYTLYMLPLALLNKSKAIRIILIIITCIVLFSSIKRAGVLALAAGLLTYIFVTQYVLNKLNAKHIIISLSLITILAGLFFYLGSMGEDENETLLARFENIGKDSGSGRTEVWEKAGKMISNEDFGALLTGNGFNAVVRDSPIQLSAHNDFLEVTYDYGLIGLVLYVCAILSLGVYVAKLVFKKSKLAPPAAMLYAISIILSLISHIIIYYWASIVMMTYGYILAAERNNEDR